MEGTILLVANIAFFVFIVVGMLFGLRGLKKQGVRFGFFFAGIILAGLVAPLLSRAIMRIQLTYNGTLMSLSDIVLSVITQTPEVQEVINASPAIKELIQNMPIMLGNVLTFAILSYVFTFLSWVVYLVFAKIIKKDEAIKKENGEKVKKHKIWGCLLGAVQGLILCFVTFLPFSGVANMLTEIQAQTVVAQETTVAEKSPTAILLDKNLPQDAKDAIKGYSRSILCHAGNIFNLNNNLFNSISSVKVNNITIYLRDEVINITKVYDNTSFLFDVTFDLNGIKTLDYNKLTKAIDYVFNSNILKTALPDFVNYSFDKLLENDQVKADNELVLMINSVKQEMSKEKGLVKNLEKEIKCLIETVKTVATSPIIDELPVDKTQKFTETNIKNIVNSLSKDNKVLFNKIIDSALDSKFFNKAVVFGINKGLDKVDSFFQKELNDTTIDVGNIDITKEDNVLKKAEAKSMLGSLLNIATEFIDADFEAIKNDFTTVFDYNVSEAILNVGAMMNAIQNMSVFNTTGIYANIITELSKTSYNDYIEFNILKDKNVWINETKMLSGAISKLVESQAISYIEKTATGYTISLENMSTMLKKLTVESEVNGVNKTVIRQILEPIYNSKVFEKLVKIGMNFVNQAMNEMGSAIHELYEKVDMNLKELFSEEEKVKVLSFIDNVAIYVSSLDLQKVKDDPFVTILNSNITQLGTCLDLIKSLNIFQDYEVDGVMHNGVYTSLVDALLKTEYTKYINFACFKEPTFKFNEELNKVKPTIDKILTKEIILPDSTKVTLLKYIVTNGDWETIFKQLDKVEIKDLFTPLMQSRIFEPIGVLVVNKINEQIKTLVGTELGSKIPQVDNLTQEEVNEVVDVLVDVVDIIDDVTAPDFQISDYAKGQNKEKLGNLLDKLQQNEKNNGVFAESYNAMLNYVKADPTIGGDVTTIINDYETKGEDWTWSQLINELNSVPTPPTDPIA